MIVLTAVVFSSVRVGRGRGSCRLPPSPPPLGGQHPPEDTCMTPIWILKLPIVFFFFFLSALIQTIDTVCGTGNTLLRPSTSPSFDSSLFFFLLLFLLLPLGPIPHLDFLAL